MTDNNNNNKNATKYRLRVCLCVCVVVVVIFSERTVAVLQDGGKDVVQRMCSQCQWQKEAGADDR